MEWFCTEEARSVLQRREKRLTAVFWSLAGITAAAFIILCLLVRTRNAQVMHWVLMAVAAVPGCLCILLWLPGVQEARTRLAHLDLLREGEKTIREGRLTLTREVVRIPKSILIRKVLLDTGKEDPERLNLDEGWVTRMPPDGSLVRLAVSHGYIAGVELLEEPAAGNHPVRRPARMRRAARLVPLLGIWILAAVFVSSFIFYQITDTDPAHKITIWFDGEVREEARLADLLEKQLEAPVRMVQIHPFRYSMFGSALQAADLYIVPDRDREQFAEWFAAPEESFTVYDPGSGTAVAASWFLYAPDDIYRLYSGAGSVHLEDGLARRAAELLIAIGTEKEDNP